MPFDQSDFEFASPQVELPVTDGVLRVLIEARGIHEDEGRWAHLAGMGDCENTFCVIAAANHRKYRRRDQGWFEIEPYIDAALRDMNYRYSVVSFSYDEKTTHPMLMEMWDRAIAARRAEIGS